MKKNLLTLILVGFLALSSNAQRVFLSEDFENASDTTPPTGWTQDILYSLNTALDQWNFDNPGNQTPDTSSAAGFDTDFAVIDRTNGIVQTLNNVALVSPKFSTQGYNSIWLKYAHAIIPGTAVTCYVEINNGDGVWYIVRQYANARIDPRIDSVNITTRAINTCEAQVRFRYQSNDGGSWMVDNVMAYTRDTVPRETDVRVIGFLPTDGSCGSTDAEIFLQVRNDGTSSVSNVPLFLEIFDGNTTQTFRDTISTMGTCVDTVFKFTERADISDASINYRIFAYSSLSGDERRSSDTLRISSFQIIESPMDPMDKNKEFCGFQNTIRDTVQVGTNEIANWYRTLNSTNVLGTGEFFSLSNIRHDTSIFVQLFKFEDRLFPQSMGVAPSLGYPNNSSGTFIDIVAKKDIIIDQLEVNPRFAGLFEYEVYVKDGSYVGHELNSSAWTLSISSDTNLAAGATAWVSTGGINIKAGDTVGIYLYNSSTLTMHFSSGSITGDGDDFSYSTAYIHAAASFSGAGASTGFGYGSRFRYKVTCASYRAEYNYQVTPKLFGANIDTLPNFLGIHREISNASTPDVIYIGETFDYELSPPTGYTYGTFGSTWAITDFQMATSNNVAIPAGDTATIMPGQNQPARLTITPSSSLQNSTIEILVTLTDLDRFCDTVVSRYIRIIELPKFDLDIVNPCANSEFRVINRYQLPPEGYVFSWNFGDGNFSSEKFPRHKYANPGTYTVTYEISTIEGLTVDTSFTVVITETPVADFGFENACFGQPVTFTNRSAVSSGTMTYFWDFDRQGTSTSENPTFAFDADGTFDVMLKVTKDGCSDSMINTVRQFEVPTPNFSTTGGCHNAEITFVNTSSLRSGEAVGAYWDFIGDGNLRTGNTISYNFNSVGTKQVKIIAESAFKCKDSITKPVELIEAPMADFGFDALCDKVPTNFENKTSQPAGVAISYQWNFGDGKFSSDENPVHQFTSASNFVVGLTAIGSNGCRSTASQTLRVKIQPLANFNVQDGCSNSELNFFNNSTSNVPGSQYLWNFDDGNTSTEFSPTHTYLNPGTYKVELRASIEECVTTMERDVLINESPTCGFRFEQSTENLRQFTFFPDVETYAEYRWRFDNTGNSTQVSPTHTFPVANRNYTIRLDVKSDNGCECRLDGVNVFTGVNNVGAIEKGNFNIYPNPTSNAVTIELIDYDQSSALDVYVMDSKGKTVITNLNVLPNNNLIGLNLEGLTSGMYLIQIRNGNSFHTERISVIK